MIMLLCMMLLAGCGSIKTGPSASEEDQKAQISSDGSGEEITKEASEAGEGSVTETPEAEEVSKKDSQEEKQENEDYFAFNGVANSYYGNRAASDGKDLYYVKQYKIFRLNPDGEDEQLFSNDGSVVMRDNMTGGDGKLFYFAYREEKDESGNDLSGIYCYDTAVGTETFLNIRVASKLYYHDSWLYYYDGNEKQFRRCRADGAEDMFLAEGWGEFFSVSGKGLYYPDGHGKMLRVDLDTLEIEEVQSSRSRVWFAYQGELLDIPYCLFNTDGDLLYITTPNGLFSSHSAENTEETLLFETDHEPDSNGFPAFDSIVIAGDYISFESGYAGEYHWYVIKKDGTLVKEIPY